LTIYILYDMLMNKAIIEFLPDQSGKKQVLDLLLDLQEKARFDHGYEQLFARIMRGLEFLEQHGVTKDKVVLQFDGAPYTLQLVKELKHHVPLCEFRVNWRGTGAFRAIFLVSEYEGKELLMFARAMVKQERSDAGFELLIHESKQILAEYLQIPENQL
jgi:sulfatase maturation enzyme AslB (radical SAM superfamily)